MNIPPVTYIRVRYQDLHDFVSKAARVVGLPEDKSELLAQLLTSNDLRGIFSHGTQQIAGYAPSMRDGGLNNKPEIRVVQETPVSLLVDGDGGLGYFPVYEGTLAAIEKANSQGIAILLTRNHGHIGAAGLYSRVTLKHDLLSFVASGSQLHLSPGQPVFSAAGGPPMSFTAPTDEEDPCVLDFGAMHDLYARSPYRDEIVQKAPGIVFRSIGLGAICQSWAGLLAGIPFDPSRAQRRFTGANQGALLIVFKISLFMSPEQFKKEMDEYVRAVRGLKPLEGFDHAYLPGGIEAERERTNRQEGIPVGPEHQQSLEKLADELGITVPWKA